MQKKCKVRLAVLREELRAQQDAIHGLNCGADKENKTVLEEPPAARR
ncbi:MAG: hypothetical protein AAF483_17645 [Planctomycetota bacterium]